MLRGKPGYEHLNEALHVIIEAELPVNIVDARLAEARNIIEDLLKPVVRSSLLLLTCYRFSSLSHFHLGGANDSSFQNVHPSFFYHSG